MDAYKTEEVETAVSLLCVLAALNDNRVLVELAFLDRDIDLDNVLPDDTASTDVKMSEKRLVAVSVDEDDSVRTRPQSYP